MRRLPHGCWLISRVPCSTLQPIDLGPYKIGAVGGRPHRAAGQCGVMLVHHDASGITRAHVGHCVNSLSGTGPGLRESAAVRMESGPPSQLLFRRGTVLSTGRHGIRRQRRAGRAAPPGCLRAIAGHNSRYYYPIIYIYTYVPLHLSSVPRPTPPRLQCARQS